MNPLEALVYEGGRDYLFSLVCEEIIFFANSRPVYPFPRWRPQLGAKPTEHQYQSQAFSRTRACDWPHPYRYAWTQTSVGRDKLSNSLAGRKRQPKPEPQPKPKHVSLPGQCVVTNNPAPLRATPVQAAAVQSKRTGWAIEIAWALFSQRTQVTRNRPPRLGGHTITGFAAGEAV